MDKMIELIAEDIADSAAKAVKTRLHELMDGEIPYAAAIAALNDIKNTVNAIMPDRDTVIKIKHILAKYKIEPKDQFYFLARAEIDSENRRKDRGQDSWKLT